MKFTLDTNVFLHGFTEDLESRNALKKYLSETDSFFCKKVFTELAGKRGEWAMLIGQLTRKWDGKSSLRQTFDEIKEFFNDQDEELMSYGNIIDYLETRRTTTKAFSLKNERTRLLSYIGGYLAAKKPIYPIDEMLDKVKNGYDEAKRKINAHDLVEGEQDKRIIQELYIIANYFTVDVTLVTKNTKDFHVEKPEWKKEIGNIQVIHPRNF